MDRGHTSLSRSNDRSASSNHAAVEDFAALPGDGLAADGIDDGCAPLPPPRTGVDPAVVLNELDRCKIDDGGK